MHGPISDFQLFKFQLFLQNVLPFVASKMEAKNGGSVRRLVNGSFFFVFMGIGAFVVLHGDE